MIFFGILSINASTTEAIISATLGLCYVGQYLMLRGSCGYISASVFGCFIKGKSNHMSVLCLKMSYVLDKNSLLFLWLGKM